MNAPTARRRTLLLLDDEPNIISSLKRLLRADGYTIIACTDPVEALQALDREPVDVILSDQRMPGMSGVEFLRRARESHPDTVRIALSGYSELQFITEAINDGAIYKFLTKPWDDEQLRHHIAEAFRSKEIADENCRLTEALQEANAQLRRQAESVERQARRIEAALDTTQEVLQLIPWPILGLDDDGLIALANTAAGDYLGRDLAPLLGRTAQEALRDDILDLLAATPAPERLRSENRNWRVILKPMGRHSESSGRLLALLPCELCA